MPVIAVGKNAILCISPKILNNLISINSDNHFTVRTFSLISTRSSGHFLLKPLYCTNRLANNFFFLDPSMLGTCYELSYGSFTFSSSCFSSKDINYLISDVFRAEFYVILFVICILVTFILYIDVAPSVRNK